MVPYSGGSSLEANFAAPYGGMSIDFAFMDRILVFNEDDMGMLFDSVKSCHSKASHLLIR